MEKRNAFRDLISPLEFHQDDRGSIADLFYNESINHVAIIDSKKDVVRGNHYHKKTIQDILIVSGSLEYWYKPFDRDCEPKCEILREGDVASSPPYEIHTMRTLEDTRFIVFTKGVRGGKDYESDTYRVDSIIPSK